MAKTYKISENQKIAFNAQKQVVFGMLDDIGKGIQGAFGSVEKEFVKDLTAGKNSIAQTKTIINNVSAEVEEGLVYAETLNPLEGQIQVLDIAFNPFVAYPHFIQNAPVLKNIILRYSASTGSKKVLFRAMGELVTIIKTKPTE